MVSTVERQTYDTDALRTSSLRHNWMHFRNWNEMAEEGEPLIIAEGHGLNVYDTDGNEWLDVNGGYLCVNVGYGRPEIGEAVREQMMALSFTPRGTTTEPVVKAESEARGDNARRSAEVLAGHRGFRGERDRYQDRQGIPEEERGTGTL